MKIGGVSIVAAVAAIALMVESSFAFGFLDGFGMLQNYYGAAAPSAALPPAPAPALPLTMPLSMPPALPPALPPMFCAPPPPPPPPCAPLALPPPPAPQGCGCGSCCDKGCCNHPSCLSFLKPCLHAKLLNLKKKLLEKKLTHLLACCAQYNNHLCAQPCPQC